MKKIFLVFCLLPFTLVAQYSVEMNYGRALYTTGDLKGDNMEVGIIKELNKVLDIGFRFGIHQFSNSDQYFYRKATGLPSDQIAEFRRITYTNEFKPGVRAKLLNKRLKFIIEAGPDLLKLTSSAPLSYGIVFPETSGYPLPIYQMSFASPITKWYLGAHCKLKLEYRVSKGLNLGLGLSNTIFKEAMIWTVPFSVNIRLPNEKDKTSTTK